MASLGTLSSFDIGRKYIYGLSDLQKTINGITYVIFIDINNSAKKTTRSGAKSTSPTNVKYGAMIKFKGGAYGVKRNLSTKMSAKKVLESVKSKLDKVSDKGISAVKTELTKISKKS